MAQEEIIVTDEPAFIAHRGLANYGRGIPKVEEHIHAIQAIGDAASNAAREFERLAHFAESTPITLEADSWASKFLSIHTMDDSILHWYHDLNKPGKRKVNLKAKAKARKARRAIKKAKKANQ